MADGEIKFKTFGGSPTGTVDQGQGQAPLGQSFAERAAAIKARMAQSGTAAPVVAGAPNRADAYMLQRLSEGQNTQPDDLSAAEYAQMPTGEYAMKVAGNIPRSIGNQVSGFGTALMDPVGTATTIGKLGVGVGSKALDAAGNAVGYGPVLDPATKGDREAVADALGQNYKSRFDFTEGGEGWKHLAEDPAAYLADAATVLSGGAGAASKLGVISKTGNLAKYGNMASNLDPVQAAMTLAGKGASTVGKAVPYGLMTAQNAVSGIPFKTLKVAREVGLSGDPQKVEAFVSALKGNPNFSGEAVDALENAIDDMANKASDSYMTDQATAFGRTQPVNLTGPSAARDVVENMITPSGVLQAPVAYAPSDIAEARSAIDQIDNALTHPSQSAKTIQELDVVKKYLDTIAKRIDHPALRSRVQAMAGELVDAMAQTDPAYGKMMSGWQEYKRQLNNVRKEFGTKAMSDVARTRKLSRAFSSKNGNEIFNMLEGTPSGQNLRYSLAGDALKNPFSDRMHNTVAGLGGPLAMGMTMGMHPAMLPASALGLALASPRVAGTTQYNLGRAERAVNSAARKAADVVAPPIITNVGSQIGSSMDEREGRKSGGRVSSHDMAADQLVRAAERAKKGLSAQTEPLLNQSDETVVKALEVANRSI
jgi:hypothetical protein